MAHSVDSVLALSCFKSLAQINRRQNCMHMRHRIWKTSLDQCHWSRHEGVCCLRSATIYCILTYIGMFLCVRVHITSSDKTGRVLYARVFTSEGMHCSEHARTVFTSLKTTKSFEVQTNLNHPDIKRKSTLRHKSNTTFHNIAKL